MGSKMVNTAEEKISPTRGIYDRTRKVLGTCRSEDCYAIKANKSRSERKPQHDLSGERLRPNGNLNIQNV